MSSTSKSSIAVSRPINPKGAETKLTLDQIWQGLNMKARKPSTFVPAIVECIVEVDTVQKVVRHVKFENKIEMTETVHFFEPTIVYFEGSNGMRITNMVSYDSDGELLLTYSFSNGVPGHPTIDDPVAVSQSIGKTVEHGIQRIRELVADGTIA